MGPWDQIIGSVLNLVNWIYGVTAALPQLKTNGKSVLGTFSAKILPLFLLSNPLPNGTPWSLLTASGTNPYNQFPSTGVVRSYDFTISRGVIAPDGYQKQVLLVNGAFPGPTIEANWGDTIQVNVHNNITDDPEGTAIHWHGFLHQGMPWEDGAPAVTQCPIAPGKSYTYTIKATLYGTSWYHSHYSAQYSGGLFGPIVIYGPLLDETKYDTDLGPITLNDWYHEDYFSLVEQVLAPNGTGRVFSNNNLINGKMNFDCSTVTAGDKTPCTNNAGISKFKFTKGKTHRLRLINAGSDGTQRFSIDGHTLTVIANDFVPIEPYTTKVVTLGVGQRADVLVKADGDARGAYWMRSNITSCSLALQPLAVAAVYYQDADTNKAPTSAAWDVPDPGTCTNDDLALTKPAFKLEPPAPSTTLDMEVAVTVNASGVVIWKFDGVGYRGNYNAPPLLLAKMGNLSYPAEWNVRNLGSNSSVRVVVINNSPAAHPMHLHGFNMYILHEGPGLTWDGTIVNPSNPTRRDVQMVRAFGHLVVQFDAASNPGMWPFHCHIAWHSSAGFFAQMLTGPEKIREMKFPSTVAQTCREWGIWTQTNIPDQIDSGL